MGTTADKCNGDPRTEATGGTEFGGRQADRLGVEGGCRGARKHRVAVQATDKLCVCVCKRRAAEAERALELIQSCNMLG